MTEDEMHIIKTRSELNQPTLVEVPYEDIFAGKKNGQPLRLYLLGLKQIPNTPQADFYFRKTEYFGINTPGCRDVKNPLSGSPEVHRILLLDVVKPIDQL